MGITLSNHRVIEIFAHVLKDEQNEIKNLN